MMKKTVLMVVLMVMVGLGLTVGADCPEKNAISKMESDMPSFKEVSPLKYSNLISTGAMLKKNGTRLEVYLSNGNFNIKEMSSSFVVPIKKKEEFIAVIQFSNGKEPIKPGTYSGASGYGKPLWAYAEVKLYKGEKGVISSFGVKEGTATIVKMTKDHVCGTFSLSTKEDASIKGKISGTFNVKMEVSKY